MKIEFKILLLLLFTIGLNQSILGQTNSKKLKVMTYNIWNGFDWGKDSLRNKELIHWVKEQNPDVLALQELCGYDESKLRADAEKWGHPYVYILKERGYPTGLTSKEPIELIEKNVDNFWHGLLHVKTYGIDFFVVHLSPSDSDIRLREARQIKSRIQELQTDSYLILGDFNSHSPLDAYWLESKVELKASMEKKEGDQYDNLRHGEFDYAPISEFLSVPAIDLGLNKLDFQESFTFPAPVLVGQYGQTPETILQNRVRIDYILASPKLAKQCVNLEVFNQGPPEKLSDHFPVMAEFEIFQEK